MPVSWVLNDLEIWPMVYDNSLFNIWILVIVVLQCSCYKEVCDIAANN